MLWYPSTDCLSQINFAHLIGTYLQSVKNVMTFTNLYAWRLVNMVPTYSTCQLTTSSTFRYGTKTKNPEVEGNLNQSFSSACTSRGIYLKKSSSIPIMQQCCKFVWGLRSSPNCLIRYTSKRSVLWKFNISDNHIMHLGLLVPMPCLLPNCNQIWYFWTDFNRSLQYQIWRKFEHSCRLYM